MTFADELYYFQLGSQQCQTTLLGQRVEQRDSDTCSRGHNVPGVRVTLGDAEVRSGVLSSAVRAVQTGSSAHPHQLHAGDQLFLQFYPLLRGEPIVPQHVTTSTDVQRS